MAQPTVYGWKRLALDVKTDQGNAGDIRVDSFTAYNILCRLSALAGGTAPSVQFIVDFKMEDGTYVQMVAAVALTATGTSIISIGPGTTNAMVSGVVARIRWTVVGAPTTATADLYLVGELEY